MPAPGLSTVRDAAEQHRIEVDGVKGDVMETWPLPDDCHDLPDDDLDRLFVIAPDGRWTAQHQ